jgi:hypothetical protein
VEVDEAAAKAIILGLNGIGGRMKELEEARIVQALVREDGLSQLQAAELLGRQKSWVCRRLALLERLSEECREDLRLGLPSPTIREHVRALPRGYRQADSPPGAFCRSLAVRRVCRCGSEGSDGWTWAQKAGDLAGEPVEQAGWLLRRTPGAVEEDIPGGFAAGTAHLTTVACAV